MSVFSPRENHMEFGHFSYPNLDSQISTKKRSNRLFLQWKMFVFWPPEKSEKSRSGARRKISIFWLQILLRNFNFRLAVGGDPSKPHMISFHEVELNRNEIELNWIENSLSWSWIGMLWIEIEMESKWIEVNRTDLKLNWFVEMKSSWYRHGLIRIDVDFDFGFNWIELKFTSIEAGWNWI